MMNKRIIYFIIAIVLFLQFKKVENLDLDVDAMIEEHQESVITKMGDKIPASAQVKVPAVNNLVNAAIKGEDLTSSIDELVNNAILEAAAKENAVNISTDNNEISDEVIENEPTVEVSQPETIEEEGGGMNITLIIFIILSMLIIVGK